MATALPQPHPARFRAAALPAVGLALAAPGARAADPPVVDDAGVHPPGESEWVATADALRPPAAEAPAGNFSLAVGMLPRREGSLGFGYGWVRDRAPPVPRLVMTCADFPLGLKAPFLSGDAAPFAVTLSATVKRPTASAGLRQGTGAADLNVLAIATRSWGAVMRDRNAGFTWTAAAALAAI